ncbi:MAG: ComEC/Rec2 family competence protein [Spirochaetales bacterium]|nr:ComEC/Rec2 family competence protein [Spirochaetales bacterium]
MTHPLILRFSKLFFSSPPFKRRFSFSLYLSVSMVAVFFKIRSSNEIVAMLILAAGVILVGPGILLLVSSLVEWKKIGLFLIAVASGIFLAYGFNSRIEAGNRNCFTGLNLPEISGFSGYIIRDSVPTRTGKTMHSIYLESVRSDARSVSAGAGGKVRIICTGSRLYYTGQKISVTAKISRQPDDPDAHYIAFCKDDAIHDNGFPSFPWKVRYVARKALEDRMKAMGYPAYGLFAALFVGDRTYLPEDVFNGFRDTGTLHILALSGLHVAIVYAFVMLLLLPLPFKTARYAAGFCFLAAYLFLCGPSPALVRATVMLIALGLGKLASRKISLPDNLALACLLILLFDPGALLSLSFQLSFLALAGYSVLGKRITRWLTPYLPAFLCAPIAFSVSAQLATLPLVLQSFAVYFPVGIIVTLILTPLVTVFLWSGLVYLFIGALPVLPLHAAGSLFFQFLYRCIVFVTDFFRFVPGLALKWEPYYIVFYVLLVLLCSVNITRSRIMRPNEL